MADNKQVKSKRDLALEGLRARHPEAQFDDDEAIFGQINDDFVENDKRLSDYKANEEALAKMFSDERLSGMLMRAKDGEDPVLYLVREFGPDIADRLSDPEFQAEVEKAGKEHADALAENQKFNETYSANVEQSINDINTYQQERGLSDDEMDALLATLSTIVADAVAGKITAETLDMVAAAKSHDADVEQARQDGVVEGKNAKIQASLRKGKRGDGTAHLNGMNGGAGQQQPKRDLGALGNFGEGNKNIYERGGEVRHKANR